MKVQLLVLFLGAAFLLACGLANNVAPELVPAAPTAALPPSPSQGGVTKQVDEAVPDFRIGQSGNSCGALAADLTKQRLIGKLTIFPELAQNQVRAVTNDAVYHGTAALLDSNCQPNGTQYGLTANFGADYGATLGKAGGAYCIQSSHLALTSFSLKGLPGPVNALAQSFVESNLESMVTPYLDELVARQVNGGNLPSSGARCP